MKKTFADVLRALARRLDPPAPITVNIYPLTTSTASSVAGAIKWHSGGQA